MEKAKFARKVISVEDYKNEIKRWKTQDSYYVIEKIVELEENEFNSLCNDFFESREYITKNIEHMWKQDGVWHCIQATCKGKRIGILIESEGYDYARYTAVIEVQDE